MNLKELQDKKINIYSILGKTIKPTNKRSGKQAVKILGVNNNCIVDITKWFDESKELFDSEMFTYKDGYLYLQGYTTKDLIEHLNKNYKFNFEYNRSLN